MELYADGTKLRTVKPPALKTNHEILLLGLLPGTDYRVKVKTVDANGYPLADDGPGFSESGVDARTLCPRVRANGSV